MSQHTMPADDEVSTDSQQRRFDAGQARGDEGMSNLEAMRLSLAMSRSDLPREVKDQIASGLMTYYRDLLASRLLPIVPTVRRMN